MTLLKARHKKQVSLRAAHNHVSLRANMSMEITKKAKYGLPVIVSYSLPAGGTGYDLLFGQQFHQISSSFLFIETISNSYKFNIINMDYNPYVPGTQDASATLDIPSAFRNISQVNVTVDIGIPRASNNFTKASNNLFNLNPLL